MQRVLKYDARQHIRPFYVTANTNLALEIVEPVELCAVRDGFFTVSPLEAISSLLRPGQICTVNGLKLVVK
jgi:hypothetical protein